MSIQIIESNSTKINQAIPVLANGYNQLEEFADQLSTAVDQAGVDPATLGSFTYVIQSTGLDALASPATKPYTTWTVTISWDATDSVWAIDSIVRVCDNAENTTL